MEEIRAELLAIHGESDRIRYAIDVLVPETGTTPAVRFALVSIRFRESPDCQRLTWGCRPVRRLPTPFMPRQLSSSPARPSPR